MWWRSYFSGIMAKVQMSMMAVKTGTVFGPGGDRQPVEGFGELDGQFT